MTLKPTPTTNSSLPHRRSDFDTLWQALDYAAKGATGLNFYSAKGDLQAVFSYAELRDRAQDMARRFLGLGLQRGSRIVLVADTDMDFVTAFFATQYAGLLPVPVAIPTSLGGRDAYVAQLRQQIAGCEASLAMAPQSLLGFLAEAVKGLDHVRMAASAADFMALPTRDADLKPFAADEPGYLQYSSGSTRFPKGIEIHQRVLMANAYAITHFGLNITESDRCASWLPFYHDMGLVGFLLVPATGQVSVDYIATRDFARRPLTWLKLIAENRGSLAYSPTFGYELCTKRMRGGTEFSGDLGCWRAAGIGGDMVQDPILRRFSETFGPFGFHHEAFVPSYGMAETTLAMSFAPLDRAYHVDHIDRGDLEDQVATPVEPGRQARALVACGKALPGHAFEIRDESGALLPERRIGRIFFRGPSVMSGYFGQPELTAEAIGPDGWLNTGDLGYLLDGEIVITGRAKDLIIINGRNIWPQDLEWTAETLPDLRRGDTAAFSMLGDNDEEQVVILVQCRVADLAARTKLKQDVAALLQRSMSVEARVELVPPKGLPQTSSGKLSRAKAKANFLAGHYANAEFSISA
ncbi:fatty-acyl-CoA synthase [Dongia mobilis]|uniref:Fatty-acyl-CoA synthase n=1 Tax=Dongia mobilis TaxID=578943 RepID=A0A4R6WRP4_9PROT|nr:fatty acyl-AMP ligase [Dongia mobilis]TDQ81467.1 fatty-acyl-CoA synthase [Dongia mobilis]